MVNGARKFLVWLAGVLSAGAAVAAFSSERWLAERADDSDMLRLRAAFAECAKKAVAPAENVSMVLDTHPDGTVKSRITAARATIFPDSSYVWAEKIQLEQFDSTVKGRGIYFSLTREFIKIFSQSEIRTKGRKIDPRRVLK